MFQSYEAVTNAAREGARLGVLADYTATEAQNRALGLSGRQRAQRTGSRLRHRHHREELAMRTDDHVRRCAVGRQHRRPETVDQVTMIVEFDHEYQFVGPILGLFGGTLASIRLRSASSMRPE